MTEDENARKARAAALKPNDEVIREAYDHNLPVRPHPPPLLDPQVENVVQVDVRQQR